MIPRLLILIPLVFAAYVGKAEPKPNLVVAIPVPPAKEQPVFSQEELKCAADMVAGEAGSESFKGRAAVAAVAIRRSLSAKWPDDLCDVVRELNQFYGYSKRRHTDSGSLSSVRYAITHLVDYPEAFYFHRKEIPEASPYQYTIGNHTFYRKIR